MTMIVKELDAVMYNTKIKFYINSELVRIYRFSEVIPNWILHASVKYITLTIEKNEPIMNIEIEKEKI